MKSNGVNFESQHTATITELAQHEGIAPSYMTRVLRLTLLIEAIVDGAQGPQVTLARLLVASPVEWRHQSDSFG